MGEDSRILIEELAEELSGLREGDLRFRVLVLPSLEGGTGPDLVSLGILTARG